MSDKIVVDALCSVVEANIKAIKDIQKNTASIEELRNDIAVINQKSDRMIELLNQLITTLDSFKNNNTNTLTSYLFGTGK